MIKIVKQTKPDKVKDISQVSGHRLYMVLYPSCSVGKIYYDNTTCVYKVVFLSGINPSNKYTSSNLQLLIEQLLDTNYEVYEFDNHRDINKWIGTLPQ